MAVLYRSHFHALELQLELKRRNIPFSITSGIRFFEQAHMKDVAAYLRLILNPRDELAFRRLAQMLPGIGEKAAQKLWKIFREKAHGLNPDGNYQLATSLQSCAEAVPKKAVTAWAQFVATIAQLESGDIRNDASRMISLVLEAGYEDYLEENYSSPRSRLADVQQLAGYAHQFDSVEELLTNLALMSNLEAEDEDSAARDDEDDRVRLSTIHQAKGLEFDVVFIIMLCEGLFPADRSMQSPDGEEEERRLFYVALTRARNEVYLSYPLYRDGYAAGAQLQSRFLKEIPSRLVQECNLRPY
jgi:DNA helicase-2/ATP-dependent DNA helicase PcrA